MPHTAGNRYFVSNGKPEKKIYILDMSKPVPLSTKQGQTGFKGAAKELTVPIYYLWPWPPPQPRVA